MVPKLSSDPHCDLAVLLERFVQAAANMQDGDSEDITSRADNMPFCLERIKYNVKSKAKHRFLACYNYYDCALSGAAHRLRPGHL